jgi:aminoglycoside 6'-N-acetyltransferase
MDASQYRTLNFKPLKEEDLPVLYAWLQAKHVREFYHRKTVPSWKEMHAEYIQRLDPDWPTRCFFSYSGVTPLGYIQTYRVEDYPEYGAMIGEDKGISLDLFIGDAALIGKGWGRLILLKFLRDVAFPMFCEEHVCWIYHDKQNHRALCASRAAGFRHVRSFTEDGDLKELLALNRDEVSSCNISSR